MTSFLIFFSASCFCSQVYGQDFEAYQAAALIEQHTEAEETETETEAEFAAVETEAETEAEAEVEAETEAEAEAEAEDVPAPADAAAAPAPAPATEEPQPDAYNVIFKEWENSNQVEDAPERPKKTTYTPVVLPAAPPAPKPVPKGVPEWVVNRDKYNAADIIDAPPKVSEGGWV